MADGVNKNIYAASANLNIPSGIFSKIILVFTVGFLAWAYQEIQPPLSNLPGTPGGPPITGPRIKLRDGRRLTYKERGASKDVASYKIIYLHPFGSYRHGPVFEYSFSQELIEELRIYIVGFDRPSHGESDLHSNRTLKSLTLDIEELEDQLGLGSKFYIIGYSMGGMFTWSCLKYIPHRLVGVSLLTPAINYWWPGFPPNLLTEAFNQMMPQDQWAYRVSRYAPWLSYWWSTQRWLFGSSNVANTYVLSKQDREIAPHIDYSKLLI